MYTEILLSRSLSIAIVALFITSCTTEEVAPFSLTITQPSPAANTQTAAQVPATKLSPTSEPMPTLIQTTHPTAFNPSVMPTPGDCEDGYLYFATASDRAEAQPQDAIHLMCSDGSFSQVVVSKEQTIPEQQYFASLASSPDGHRLAFSTVDWLHTNGHVYLVDLSGYNAQEIYAAGYGITDLSWSADGEYLGYITYESGGRSRGAIEALHISTLSRSRVVTERSLSNEENAFTLSRFGWSPDGRLALYTGDLVSITQASLKPQGFIAEISCAPLSYECSSSDPTELGWFDNATYQVSWSPDSLSLVGVYYDKLSSSYILEIRGVDGDRLQQVNLTELLPAVERVHNPVLSHDGKRVAFVAELKTGDIDLLILTLEDLRVINLTDTTLFQEVAVTYAGWLSQ